MPKFLKILVLLLLCIPFTMFAQTGKIVGSVTDLETGEHLLGANVLIEGTNLGAATNENGDYIILNVPPGTYTIKARYIGYRESIIENIRVSVNLTTEANFALPSETYQTEVITVVAPKPLINKNITNSTSIVNAEDIENLPVRGVNGLVSIQAGVVNQGGNLYIRGNRSDAVSYYVDGVLVNNPVFGGAQAAPINNAIEEIQLQAGGYSAEFGGANGGIISTTSKSGSDKYKLSFEAISDAFVKPGESYLGGFSYGYTEMVFTAGGPVVPGFKNFNFFLAGNNIFRRTPAQFRREYNFPQVVDPTIPNADTISIAYPNGYIMNDATNTYQLQGNLTYDLRPFTFRLTGNYTYNEGRNGVGWRSTATEASAGLHEDNTLVSSFKITQVINPNSFYDVIINYFGDFYVDMDPIFKHDIKLYGDSIANAANGRLMRRDGETPTSLRGFGLTFTPNEIPYDFYRKQKTQSFGGKINFLYQIGKHHEFKTGGDFTYYTIRRYSIAPVAIASNQKGIADGDIRGIYDRLDNYGYDIFGNSTNDDPYTPKHPVFGAFYIMDKMEFTDLVFNLGFRLDYIDVDSKEFIDPSNVLFDQDDIINPAGQKDLDPLLQVSPRIGLSFPVTDRTVFHAQYGKFIQQSRLRDLYLGLNRASDIIKGGFAELNPVGYGLRPERTTSYEIGFRQQVGENFAFDITGFYKDIKDQIQTRSIFADPNAQHSSYYAYVNGDFETVKGVEFKLDLRRTQRLSATFDYTFSDARGTGSTPNEAARSIWQSPTRQPFFPLQTAPLTFNRAHSGALNFDYRFAKDDGPEVLGSQILQRTGLNLLFKFASGFNYTRWKGFRNQNSRTPTEPLNTSTTPWTFQLDARLDKSFNLGPLNLNVYLWVINVLNTQNVLSVFNTTGDPYDDGFLASPQGEARIEGYRQAGGEQAAETYKALYLADLYSAGNFGTPRQIRLGIRLDY